MRACGLAANLDIEQAGARVREARAQLRGARGALLPSLDVFANQSRLVGGARRISGGDRSTFQAGFDAAYEVDLFGGIRRSAQVARATAQGSEANLRAVQPTVASEIALNYLAAPEAQARLQIACDTQASRETTSRTLDRSAIAPLLKELSKPYPDHAPDRLQVGGLVVQRR